MSVSIVGGTTSASAALVLNAQTGTTYTLVAADAENKLVTTSNASAVTVTVPPSVFTVGQQINVASIGVGLTSFAQGAGVTITSTGATAAAPILRAQYSAGTVICTATDTFLIVGDLS
jgi:ATP-dependent protease HslVU (ClpYQ) peptidase subunit